jgi:hypothetical protein
MMFKNNYKRRELIDLKHLQFFFILKMIISGVYTSNEIINLNRYFKKII